MRRTADETLRAAERAYRAERSDETYTRYTTALARAGRRMCFTCESVSTHMCVNAWHAMASGAEPCCGQTTCCPGALVCEHPECCAASVAQVETPRGTHVRACAEHMAWAWNGAEGAL